MRHCTQACSTATLKSLINIGRRLVLPIFCAALLAVAQTGPVHAAAPRDAGPGQPLVEVIFAIAKAFIQVLVFSSVAIFAASIARGTWSAQLANLVGSPMGMSQAWLNILGAIFTFVLAILSPMIVNMVFDIVKKFVSSTIVIPTISALPTALRFISRL